MDNYNELITEAKADTQRLIDFAGQELANRFFAIKNRLKAPENDLYYWIKNKTVDELASTVQELENAKSEKQQASEVAEAGAKLIAETPHWKIYHITSFEAAVKYGRDTKWCITGLENSGDKYWKDYKAKGAEFYFLITKDKYNPRGRTSKYAITLYEAHTEYDEWDDEEYEVPAEYEVFDQQDYSILLEDIPYIEEVKIPGINLVSYEARSGRQFPCEYPGCGIWMPEDQYENPTIYGQHFCAHCFGKYKHSEEGLAEQVFSLSLTPKGILKTVLQSNFDELSKEDLLKIINVWRKGRKNNSFVERGTEGDTRISIAQAEQGFIDNLKLFKNINLTPDMLQGKTDLPIDLVENWDIKKEFEIYDSLWN